MKVLRPRERPPLAPEAKKLDPPRDPLPARRKLGNEFSRQSTDTGQTRPAGGNILQQMALDEKKQQDSNATSTLGQAPPMSQQNARPDSGRDNMTADTASSAAPASVASSNGEGAGGSSNGNHNTRGHPSNTTHYTTTVPGKLSRRHGASVWDCFQPCPDEEGESTGLREERGLYAIPRKRRLNQAPANWVPDRLNRAVAEENRYYTESFSRPVTRYERDIRSQDQLWDIMTGNSDADSVESGNDRSIPSHVSDQLGFVDYKQSNNIYEALHQNPPYSYEPQDPLVKQAAQRIATVNEGLNPESRYFSRYKQKESDKLQEALVHDLSKHRAPREDYALPESKRHGSQFHNTAWDAQAPLHLSWDETGTESNQWAHGGMKSEAQTRLAKHLAGHKWMPRDSHQVTTECRDNYQGKMTGGPRQPAPKKFGKKMIVPNHMNPWGGHTKVV